MNLKDTLREQQVTIGSWMSLGVPAIAEIMGRAGFEWLVVDMEHTAITLREAENLIRVVDLLGLTPLVRLSANDPVQIKRVLDAGAGGIIVPQVNTPEEAGAAVTASRYPPTGERGVGLGRAQGYGPGFDHYVETAENQTVVIAQIEHRTAVENLADILAVPGIDGTIIGPYDLSASMGLPGDFTAPEVQGLLERYRKVSRDCGKPQGYHVVEPDTRAVLKKIEEGYTFIAISTDFLFLGESCRQCVSGVRAQLAGGSR